MNQLLRLLTRRPMNRLTAHRTKISPRRTFVRPLPACVSGISERMAFIPGADVSEIVVHNPKLIVFFAAVSMSDESNSTDKGGYQTISKLNG
jgi:hypothetical protein